MVHITWVVQFIAKLTVSVRYRQLVLPQPLDVVCDGDAGAADPDAGRDCYGVARAGRFRAVRASGLGHHYYDGHHDPVSRAAVSGAYVGFGNGAVAVVPFRPPVAVQRRRR